MNGKSLLAKSRFSPLGYPKLLLAALITLYQKAVSPFIGNRCRFYPSCSQYVKESVLRHGVVKGLTYGVRRILRCHPWNPGGYDPVK